MKISRIFNRITALALSAAMLTGMTSALAAEGDQQVYTLQNNFIKVDVSGENGGFHIDTIEGNKLNKDDNNKMLLHNSSEYDTSFTSVRITRGGETEDYIFGRSYGFLGLSGTDLKTEQGSDSIVSTWTVDDIVITQMIVLNNASSSEHGMVSINYTAENIGEETVDDIDIRILLDTALGYQDYAYYTVNGEMIEQECIISGSEAGSMMFGYDDKDDPKIVAYSVNGTVGGQQCIPEQIAFGHWNNLASTVYDFEPNPDMTFTNEYNVQYLTADSAYALYYSIGSIPANETRSIGTNYGVYANADVQQNARVSVNVSGAAPMRLNADKTAYLSGDENDPEGELSLDVLVQNFDSDYADVLSNISVVVYPTAGMNPLDENGNPVEGNLHNVSVYELPVGASQNLTFRFRPEVAERAEYRKIRFVVYLPSDSGVYLQENLIGEQEVYILCPGTDNNIPDVFLTGCTETIYYTGARRTMQITGQGFDMLTDQSTYNFTLRQVTAEGVTPKEYVFDSDNSVLDAENGVVTINLPEDLTMDVGTYSVIIDYIDGTFPDVISEAARVVVTDDEKYRPSGRNVLAIVQPDPETPKYELRKFNHEDDFKEYQDTTSEEILIYVKGCFNLDTVTEDKQGRYYYDFVRNGEHTVTINDTIETSDGAVTIRTLNEDDENERSYVVEIAGSVYMSGINTAVSDGIATITEIKNGTDYDLIHYTTDGIRCDTLTTDDPRYQNMRGKEPITYIFSKVFEKFVNLANIVNADFTYLQFGKIVDVYGNEQLDVVSVSAKIDLGFLIPKGNQEYKEKFNSAWKQFRNGVEITNPSTLRSSWNEFSQSEEAKSYASRKSKDQIMAYAEVDDILFGGGNFIGLNFTIGLGLPPLTTSMPGMSGTLTVNTIGDWRFGVDGILEFTGLTLQGRLDIIYSNELNMPIPDTIYFYLEGPPPGINIDGVGVVWIRGGGGGIEDLYELVYCPTALPSTSVLVSVGASIIQVITLQITADIGLRGISVIAEEGTLFASDIVVLRNSGVRIQWYPSFAFSANVNVDFLSILNGNGYIVVNPADDSYEFYATVGVMIPQPIPLIGGVEVAEVGVGINEEKIWGKMKIIGLGFGLLYYWGGDFSFVSADDTALEPSYPELLSENDVAVAYDEETGRTLYAHVIPNYGLEKRAEVVNLFSEPDANSTEDLILRSDADRLNHRLNLGSYEEGKDGALNITFEAESQEQALEIAEGITISNYPITLLTDSADNEDSANAFMTYDEDNKSARVVVSFTDRSTYGQLYEITTPVASTLEIYGISSLPEFSMTNAAVNDENVDISWTVENGTNENVDKISVYLCESDDPEIVDGIFVGTIDDEETLSTGSASLPIPFDTQSGSYYVEAIAVMDEDLMDTSYSSETLSFTNSSQPAQPTSISVSNAGDYRLQAEVSGDADDCDAYSVNVYEVSESDGRTVYAEVSGVTGTFEKGQELIVGGRYEVMQDTENTEESLPQYVGLEPGKTYAVGVSKVKYMTDNDGNPTAQVLSEETFSEPITLAAPQPPQVSVGIRGTDGSEPVDLENSLGNGEVKTTVPTLKTQDAVVTVTSDQPISGTWYLDNTDLESAQANGNPNGSFTGESSIEIPLSALETQGHTLHIEGENAQGDGFTTAFAFGVDNVAPVLAVSSPENGAVANDDVIQIAGETDAEAMLSVSLNGKLIGTKTAEGWDPDSENGSFSFEVSLDEEAKKLYKNRLVLSAEDGLGNTIERTFTIINDRISELEKVAVVVNGENVTNQKIDSGQDILTELSLLGITESDEEFTINSDDAVQWRVNAVDGDARVYEAGETTVNDSPNQSRMISIAKNSNGYITGEFRLTSDAGMSAAAEFGLVDAYNITYSASNGVMISGSDEAKQNERVEIEAIIPTGYQFIGWKSSSNGVQFENAASPETAFIMPGNDVVIEAQVQVIDGSALQGIIDQAKASINETSISTNGDGVAEGSYWTIQQNVTDLNNAIGKAETILEQALTNEELAEAAIELSAVYETFLKNRVPGAPVLQPVSYNPSNTLANVALSGGWTWTDGTVVPTVNQDAYEAYYTLPADTEYDWSVAGAYYDAENNRLVRMIELTVNSIDPEYDIPDNLTAVYGQTLANVQLPVGFTWQDAGTTSVGNAGDNTFNVTYTPDDTNYNTIRNIEVTVKVEQAETTVTLNAGTVQGSGENRSVDLTAEVVGVTGGEVPTGTVEFFSGEQSLGTETLTNGEAVFTWSNIPSGDYTLSAVYSGSVNYEGGEDQISINLSKDAQEELVIGEVPEKTFGDEPFALNVRGGSGTGALSYEVTSGESLVYDETTGMFSIVKAGESVIRVTKAADDYYNETSATVMINVKQKEPTIDTKPTAERVRQNNLLSSASLSGGVVTGIDGTQLTGTWTWENDREMIELGDFNETAVFTPDDTNYAAIRVSDIAVNVYRLSSGSPSGIARYTVTFDSQGGSAVAQQTVTRNDPVSKPGDPTREGYTFDGWFTDADCTEAYDFSTGVTGSLTLYAKWTQNGTTEPTDPTATTEPTDPDEPDEWENPFTDVNENDWFYEAVRYVNENGLFAGTTQTTFAPDEAITRGMLVTVLWRMEQQPTVDYLMTFDDVAQDAYYAEAVRWAASEGIVLGHSDTEFAPDDLITREQFAAILERYADFKRLMTDETDDLARFTDTDQVSDWAFGNVQWAVGAGLITGRDDGSLDPQGSATRAEAAAILQRFLER